MGRAVQEHHVREEIEEIHVGHDDFSLARVPERARYSWISVAIQRYGQLSALSQFLLGATLGFGMDFWTAFWALTLGAVILEIISILTGIAGQREGLSTSVLARWTGFGRYGSSLIGLVIAISLIGWFGVQNAVFAEGLRSLLGGPPLWVWSIITGALVTGIVVYGFLSMTWTAYVTVPAFILLAFYSVGKALTQHSLSTLMTSPAPGPHLSLAQGATLVAGGFIVGAVITPDMTRFNRTPWDVVKQTVIGITLGEYTIGLIGVLLAHAVRSADVITIVTTTSGVIGTLILIAATLKINDWNLYSSSLGLVNLIDTVFNEHLDRGFVTVAVGILGTILSATGILSHFVDFLTLLGVTIPPIAGVMIVDYYLLRRYRTELDASSPADALPPTLETWNPVTIVSWIAGSLVGHYVTWGIPSLNAFLVTAILYYVLMKAIAAVRGREHEKFVQVSTRS
jgi:cytosine permease